MKRYSLIDFFSQLKKIEKDLEDLEFRKNSSQPIYEKAKTNFKNEIYSRKKLIEEKQRIIQKYISDFNLDRDIDKTTKMQLNTYMKSFYPKKVLKK